MEEEQLSFREYAQAYLRERDVLGLRGAGLAVLHREVGPFDQFEGGPGAGYRNEYGHRLLGVRTYWSPEVGVYRTEIPDGF